jgi:hypothetical protein
MRHAAFAALALVLFATPSFAADYSDPKALVEALYAGYQPPNEFPPDMTVLQSKRLNALYDADSKEANGEIGRIDFDPFINGQDYEVTKVEIGEPVIAAGKALVKVNVVNFGEPDEFGLLLVKEDGGWKVDDVWNDRPDYAYDLLDILQAPMP